MRTLLQTNLRFDRHTAVLTVVSTLLLMVDHYHRLTPWKVLDRNILYFAVPLGITMLFFRRSPSEYGFRLGDWRVGVPLTLAGMLLIAPVLWLLGRGDVSMREYYAWQLNAAMPLETFLELFGWEFFFRGWLLFGYARRFGAEALWLQAVPFALAHIGKPEVETLSTIFGGFAFGWLAYRTRSFLYPFLLHWFVATFTVLVAAGALG
ncbi:MAG: CPBP family intramembrane metalloprotease [Anaerolineae bacterium]|nr:MAG: CPBP family intramembrane metalloprotease [Anaerolineae bacterium]